LGSCHGTRIDIIEFEKASNGNLMQELPETPIEIRLSTWRIEFMKTRPILILAISVIFVVGALAFNHRITTSKKGEAVNLLPLKQQSLAATQATPTASQFANNRTLPVAHLYHHLFKHMESLEERTKLSQQTGKNLDYTLWYEREAGLTLLQNEAFKSVSSTCLAEVKKLDDQADEVIRQVRRQYPPGSTNRAPNVPPELLELQKKRDAMILSYRDELQARLGDETFARFKKFVEDKIQPNIKVLNPSQSKALVPLPGNSAPVFIDPKSPITGPLPRTTRNQ
jgi:hypothetical protein